MRIDPNLIAYLKKNLKSFDPEALRKKLLAEGVSEEEVTQAITVATRRRSSPFAPLLMVLTSFALVGSYWAWQSRSHNDDIRPSASAPEKPKKPLSGPRAYIGRYGYVLEIPSGYETVSDFKESRDPAERVHIFPEGTDMTYLGHEGIYAQMGIFRFEARPRTVPDGRLGLDALKAQVSSALTAQKTRFESRELLIGTIPAVIFRADGPFASARAHAVGRRAVYTLVGGTDDETFMDILQSLQEVASPER